MTSFQTVLDDARSDAALAAVLREPLTTLDLRLPTRTDRRELERRLSARQARSIADLLSLAAEGALSQVAAFLLDAKIPEIRARARRAMPALLAPTAPVVPTRPTPPVLHRGMKAAVVDAWAQQSPALQALVKKDLATLNRLLFYESELLSQYPQSSLYGVLANSIYQPSYIFAEVLELANALPEAIAATAAFNAEWAPVRATPPAHPSVRAAWERARATLSRTPPCAYVPPADAFEASLREDPPSIVLSVGRHGGRVALVDLGSGTFHAVDADYNAHEFARAGLEATIDLLTHPDEATGALLRRVLDKPAWERDLQAIVRASAGTPVDPDEDKREIGWRLREGIGGYEISPVQCRPKRGGGYACRVVKHADLPDALLVDEVDQAVAELTETPQLSRPTAFQVIERLIGHPRVFFDTKSGLPVPVRRVACGLALREAPDGSVAWEASIDGEPRDPIVLAKHLSARWSVGLYIETDAAGVRVAKMPRAVARAIRQAGPRMSTVPREAVPHLVGQIDALTATLPLDLPERLAGVRQDGDARWLVRLRNADDGLHIDLLTRPLPDALAHPPGEGPAELRAARGNERIYVRRALAEEPARARAALAGTPLTVAREQAPYRWTFRLDKAGPDARDGAIEVVASLEARPEAFLVEWSGPMVRVGPLLKRVRVVVSSGRDWFGVSGTAGTPAQGVSLDDLLTALADGASFVQVKGGQWARIADTVRGPLQALAAAGQRREGTRIGAVHAPLIDALSAAGIEVDADPTFEASRTRLREAATLDPTLPDGLNAEMRPYQRDGFGWLARLAHWAPGAVLADDMGLGKTVQAIALALSRADLGPTLIVAPTSVVFNWAREIARFAPSLRTLTYHGGERAAQIATLTRGDVVLTSYGVAQRDAEALATRRFATLIVDEAQAIKNPSALRSRAIFALDAEFRLALTGTPVENAATDLWSVFRAVAPGLLPTEAAFRDRFEGPIRRGDPAARAALAGLVRPFVLRRTKRQVATDLPEKTSIVVEVTLSADEQALYERTRLQAMARLGASQSPGDRFAVLAALTRLRQLACHPRLFDPASPIASSKLHTLRRMLGDLRESGHRALVFSQFVEHLDLVEAALLEDGLKLRRIDGSTAMEARRREVDAFQAGDGDAFLISLKAGGTGLNLTAATYVFHLDPWWNPAAEDQATDRAHRIGQSQPVTVYRLVARGTIEQAILAMHGEKRTLAADLLEGTASAAPIDLQTLMGLLGGGDLGGGVVDLAGEASPEVAEAPRSMAALVPVVAPQPAVSGALASVASGFRAQLVAEQARSGLPTPSTIRIYAGAVDRLVAWAGSVGVVDRTDLIPRYPEFLASAAATKTDRTAGGVVFSRLGRFLAG